MLKTWLATQWPWIAGGAAALILGVVGWIYWLGGHDANTKVAAHAAVAQSRSDQAVVKATDHYTHDITILHDRTEKASDAIRKAPTAQDALDPGYRAQLCDQLAGVRGTGVCLPDDHGSVDAPGSLPGSDQ